MLGVVVLAFEPRGGDAFEINAQRDQQRAPGPGWNFKRDPAAITEVMDRRGVVQRIGDRRPQERLHRRAAIGRLVFDHRLEPELATEPETDALLAAPAVLLV